MFSFVSNEFFESYFFLILYPPSCRIMLKYLVIHDNDWLWKPTSFKNTGMLHDDYHCLFESFTSKLYLYLLVSSFVYGKSRKPSLFENLERVMTTKLVYEHTQIFMTYLFGWLGQPIRDLESYITLYLLECGIVAWLSIQNMVALGHITETLNCCITRFPFFVFCPQLSCSKP